MNERRIGLASGIAFAAAMAGAAMPFIGGRVEAPRVVNVVRRVSNVKRVRLPKEKPSQLNKRLAAPRLPVDWVDEWESGWPARSYTELDRRTRAGSLRAIQEARLEGRPMPNNNCSSAHAKR